VLEAAAAVAPEGLAGAVPQTGHHLWDMAAAPRQGSGWRRGCSCWACAWAGPSGGAGGALASAEPLPGALSGVVLPGRGALPKGVCCGLSDKAAASAKAERLRPRITGRWRAGSLRVAGPALCRASTRLGRRGLDARVGGTAPPRTGFRQDRCRSWRGRLQSACRRDGRRVLGERRSSLSAAVAGDGIALCSDGEALTVRAPGRFAGIRTVLHAPPRRVPGAWPRG